jgi:hypothetical protein
MFPYIASLSNEQMLKGGRILTEFKYILIKSTACWLERQSLQKKDMEELCEF